MKCCASMGLRPCAQQQTNSRASLTSNRTHGSSKPRILGSRCRCVAPARHTVNSWTCEPRTRVYSHCTGSVVVVTFARSLDRSGTSMMRKLAGRCVCGGCGSEQAGTAGSRETRRFYSWWIMMRCPWFGPPKRCEIFVADQCRDRPLIRRGRRGGSVVRRCGDGLGSTKIKVAAHYKSTSAVVVVVL